MPGQDVRAEYTNGNGAPPRASRSRSPVDRDRAYVLTLGKSPSIDDSTRRSGTEPDADNPGNNLHVSGLHSRVDNRELESAFAKVGRVSSCVTLFSAGLPCFQVEKVSVVYDSQTISCPLSKTN